MKSNQSIHLAPPQMHAVKPCQTSSSKIALCQSWLHEASCPVGSAWAPSQGGLTRSRMRSWFAWARLLKHAG
eukprot:1137916-Pelagomonas_calceolata.AAC.5